MLVGYNTNVPYKGKLYHVQTEDNGVRNPIIITLLYFKGTILASKKANYAEVAGSPDYKEKVRELMKEQHKTMIKELIRGKYTGDEQPANPSEVGEITPVLFEETEAVQPVSAEALAEAMTPEAQPAMSIQEETGQSPAAAAAGPTEDMKTDKKQMSKSLDDILLDFIIKMEK